MAILDQIENYIQSQTEAKQRDMSALHNIICGIAPKAKLWFWTAKTKMEK